MAAPWSLVPCLFALRTEFNLIAPQRRRDSDGSVGDAAHADSMSDHNPDETGHVPIKDADKVNEVHAIDVDKDLNLPGVDMERAVQFLLARCRSGAERRLRYIIWNRRIWRASNGWREERYTGPNGHTEHAHFSASYESAHEASIASWHLIDLVTPKEEPVSTSVWAEDIDPTANRYSAGGALYVAMQRTASLNQLPGDIAEVAEKVDALVKDSDVEFDAVDAALVLVNAKQDKIIAMLEKLVPPAEDQ